jgi:hypothetical protein
LAGDLIPPPSPAGRPESLRTADEESGPWSGFAAAVEEAQTPLAVVEPTPLARHRSRFGFITGALAGTAVAAIVVTILILSGGGPGQPDADGWSVWQPTSEDAFSRAAEIGAHVGRRYRLNDGSQIVAMQSGPIAVAGDVPAEVVIRTATTGGDIVPIDGEGILYTFNGLGENGSISIGEKSVERLALLRYAAIEVALYTFRYTDADHVVVILPPPPPERSGPTGATTAGDGSAAGPVSDVLFFRPGDLEAELAQPLAATIPDATPKPKDLSMVDVKEINARTLPFSFKANFQRPGDGRVYLVLERVAAPSAAGTPTATATAAPTTTATATATP